MENKKNDFNSKNIPKHIGIIMDGNGRWAKQRKMPRYFGHREGSKRVLDIVKECYKLKIPFLSLYAFSTENWKRPKKEVDNLMQLLVEFINKHIDEMHENNIRLNILGDLTPFPDSLQKVIRNALNLTENNSTMVVNIALNYGGQDEILMATRKIANLVSKGQISVEDIDLNLFEKQLYTVDQPPLDLLIRPSGELRVSNFMLYQMAYAEFWFSDVLWPDFTSNELGKAIKDFQLRNRRFGGI